MLPRISIIIPSYNKAKFIEETLISIISQKYPSLEIIIQDGASTDGTLELIKKYAKKYPYIIYESKKDKGQTDAINKGLKKATGEVLAYLNADDVYLPGALYAVGGYFKKYPRTSWLAGRGKNIDKNGKEISELATRYKNFLLTINHYSLLIMVNYLMQPSVFLSRKAFKEFGPFTGIGRVVMEYEMWLKLGKVAMPAIINKNLSSFRMSGGNISSIAFQKTLKADEKIAEKYTDNPVLLLLHNIHNIGRIITAYIMNNAN